MNTKLINDIKKQINGSPIGMYTTFLENYAKDNESFAKVMFRFYNNVLISRSTTRVPEASDIADQVRVIVYFIKKAITKGNNRGDYKFGIWFMEIEKQTVPFISISSRDQFLAVCSVVMYDDSPGFPAIASSTSNSREARKLFKIMYS